MRTRIRSGQKRAEALMKSRGTCTRKESVRDPITYVTTERESVVYGPKILPWRGICKIQSFRPYETAIASGGRELIVQRTEVHVPVGAGPFKIGDVWVIEGHPHLLRVAGLDDKTTQSAQRLLVDQISNREEVGDVPSAP